MLDRRLNYTCAYWQNAQTLDEAQEALLRTAYPSSDYLQEIFDRIRGQQPEER